MAKTADQLIDDLKRAKQAASNRTLLYEGYEDGEIVLHCEMAIPDATWKDFQAEVAAFLTHLDQFADVIERETDVNDYEVYEKNMLVEVLSGKPGVEVSVSLVWDDDEDATEQYQDILAVIEAEASRFNFPKPRPM